MSCCSSPSSESSYIYFTVKGFSTTNLFRSLLTSFTETANSFAPAYFSLTQVETYQLHRQVKNKTGIVIKVTYNASM